MYSVRPGSTIRLFHSRSRFPCHSSVRRTRSYRSDMDIMSYALLDGLGLGEFLLLPPCWAESGLGLGRHHCPRHDSNHSRDPLVELDSPRRIARTSYRRIAFPWLLASGSCPHEWTDYRHCGHGCAFRHTPPYRRSCSGFASWARGLCSDGSDSNRHLPRHRL
jgi:hypothetical protein